MKVIIVHYMDIGVVASIFQMVNIHIFIIQKILINMIEVDKYTLMPTNMRQFFSNEELQTATMHKPFNFTKNIPVMKVNKILKKTDPHVTLIDTKSALYDLKQDPGQLNQLHDNDLITRYKDHVERNKITPKELLENYFNLE